MEQDEILQQAAEIMKEKNAERTKAFQVELSELLAKYNVELLPTIQIQLK